MNRQVQEAKVILNAIDETGKGWFNHPVTKMYREYYSWLFLYMNCLTHYRDYLQSKSNDCLSFALYNNTVANTCIPPFLTEEFCIQHRRRLYTKNEEYYKQFAEYGKSEGNWYFLNGSIVKYINGKRI